MQNPDLPSLERRRRQIAAIPDAPPRGPDRAVVVSNHRSSGELVMWSLRTRGWRTSTRRIDVPTLTDLLADPPALVVVDQTGDVPPGSELGRLLTAVTNASALVVVLDNPVRHSTNTVRRRWSLRGVARRARSSGR